MDRDTTIDIQEIKALTDSVVDIRDRFIGLLMHNQQLFTQEFAAAYATLISEAGDMIKDFEFYSYLMDEGKLQHYFDTL